MNKINLKLKIIIGSILVIIGFFGLKLTFMGIQELGELDQMKVLVPIYTSSGNTIKEPKNYTEQDCKGFLAYRLVHEVGDTVPVSQLDYESRVLAQCQFLAMGSVQTALDKLEKALKAE